MDGSKSFFRFGSPSSCWVLHLFFSLGPFFDLLPSETFSVDMGPVSCPASSVASSPDYTILLRQPGVMNQFVHCDLSEVSHPRKLPVSWLIALGVRVPCFCLQICPSQSGYDAIQSVWHTLQSERASSTSGSQRVPDATPLTSPTHASPDILDDSRPKQSADVQGQNQKGPIGKRKSTRARPSSIIVPDTVTPSSRAGAGAEVDAPAHGSLQPGNVQVIQRTSSTAIGRNSPTCLADHASTENTSRSLLITGGKRERYLRMKFLCPKNKRRFISHRLREQTQALSACSLTDRMKKLVKSQVYHLIYLASSALLVAQRF